MRKEEKSDKPAAAESSLTNLISAAKENKVYAEPEKEQDQSEIAKSFNNSSEIEMIKEPLVNQQNVLVPENEEKKTKEKDTDPQQSKEDEAAPGSTENDKTLAKEGEKDESENMCPEKYWISKNAPKDENLYAERRKKLQDSFDEY